MSVLNLMEMSYEYLVVIVVFHLIGLYAVKILHFTLEDLLLISVALGMVALVMSCVFLLTLE